MRKKKLNNEEMLYAHLSEEQLETFKAYMYFCVVSPRGMVYLLHDGRSIVRMYNGRQDEHRCAYGYVGEEFAERHLSLLTQLLWLRTEPAHVMEIACSEGDYFYRNMGGEYSKEVPVCPPMVGHYAASHVPKGI